MSPVGCECGPSFTCSGCRRWHHPGTRVHAEGKPGMVASVKMMPGSSTRPEQYRVALDDMNGTPGYEGTMFPASSVFQCSYDTALVDAAAAHEKFLVNQEGSRS